MRAFPMITLLLVGFAAHAQTKAPSTAGLFGPMRPAAGPSQANQRQSTPAQGARLQAPTPAGLPGAANVTVVTAARYANANQPISVVSTARYASVPTGKAPASPLAPVYRAAPRKPGATPVPNIQQANSTVAMPYEKCLQSLQGAQGKSNATAQATATGTTLAIRNAHATFQMSCSKAGQMTVSFTPVAGAAVAPGPAKR